MKITTQIAFWSVVPVLAFLGDRCPPGKARLAFERKTVASLPQGTEARSAQFSPNGLHIAHVVHLGDKAAVALDGAICPLFESVKLGSLLFRPDGAELAYLAKAGGTWHVVRGTEPGPGFDEIPEISYAPAGSALAYLGRRGEAWFAVIDGVERGPYQKAYFLTMAPAGNRVAYAATEADGVHLHVDSDVGPPYRMVSPPVFNADGSRIGYPARKGDTWTLVVDGREGGLYAIVNGPVFAPSGAVYATVQRDGNSFVIRDGQVVSDSFRSIVTDVSLNPDGTRMGFGIAESNQARMVVDGVKGNPYGMVLPILFSGDGRHYAYAANKQGAFVLVRDGVE